MTVSTSGRLPVRLKLVTPLSSKVAPRGAHGVTCQVTPGVVHQLEMVQIHHNDAERLGLFLRAGNFAIENLEDSASIPETGQAVSHRLITKLLLRSLSHKQRRTHLRGSLRDDGLKLLCLSYKVADPR